MQMYYELKQQKSKSTVSFLILHIILITLLHLVTSLLLVVLLALLPRMVSAPIAAGAAAALVPLAAFVVAFIIIICYMFVGHISGVGVWSKQNKFRLNTEERPIFSKARLKVLDVLNRLSNIAGFETFKF
ncbi:Hypothetical_protein [Hexamita inflata]|uniref:Hypothetical_protein n=1 Tax=Hexamita inflata TaxID=28002 RepID=A0AA86TCK8_9EUKA|nr:Hypothetical protein HINF_LOCUS2594 [Hexamita inflata]